MRNKSIRNQTEIKDAVLEAKKVKWKWAGHIARYKDKRWTKSVTE